MTGDEQEEDFGTATEYINTFKLTIPEDLLFIKEYDWTTLDTYANRHALFEMQAGQTSTAISHAEYLYSISKGEMTQTVKKWMVILLEFFDIYEKRAVRYCDNSNWRDNFDIENIGDSKTEATFNTEVNKLLGSLKKKVAKLRVDKDSVIDIEVKKGFTPSLAMYNLMTEKHPEIVKFLDLKKVK